MSLPHHCLPVPIRGPARDFYSRTFALLNSDASAYANTCHRYPRADGYSRAFPNSIPALLYG